MKTKLAIVILLLISALLISCTGINQTEQELPTQIPTKEPTLTPVPTALTEVTVSGSFYMQRAGKGTGDRFVLSKTEWEYNYEFVVVDNTQAIANANQGLYQIAAVDRELTQEERAYGMQQILIGYNALAIAVQLDNPVNAVTTDTLLDIYTGSITNWKELGGDDAEIIAVNYVDETISRGLFYDFLGFDEYPDDEFLKQFPLHFVPISGSGGVPAYVAAHQYAIGYIPPCHLSDVVKALNVNGYMPSNKNIYSGDYPMVFPCYFVYHEDNLSQAAKEYLEFILSPEGQDAVRDYGLIPIEGVLDDEE